MSLSHVPKVEEPAELWELLSPKEEEVLGAVRDIVAEVRAKGELPELKAVESRLHSAGASDAELDEHGQAVLRFRGARFSLSEQRGVGIEISFISEHS